MEGGEEKLKSFSLASVAFILATITLATIAVRNLPALIEILLLDRFKVSPGARYAIKTLTAYALKDEIDRFMQSGFTAYLTKPVDLESLKRMLATL